MPHDALRTLLPYAGWPESYANAVEFTGGSDPILRTPFRIGETSAATLAAVALAISDLWRLRTGRGQDISIDVRHATASLRSKQFLKINGKATPGDSHGVMGFYPAKHGRWAYLHCNFPHHRDATLRVLGVPEDRDAIRKAVAQWDALELEEAIVAANSVGGMVRTMDEWAHHPQGKAVAALPLMEIIKIGDSKPEALPPGDRPLSGLRVLDLTRVVAGPTCARTLAEHGADVLKIGAPHFPSLGHHETDTGHGKLSAHLDLRDPRQSELLRGLARECDVFSQGYRPGTLGNRGFTPEEVMKLRPGVVYVSLCAFSHAGPWASRRGFDTVVQSVNGIAHRQGQACPEAEPGPQFYPVSAVDFLTGYLMAFGTLTALQRRVREGGSWLVRISLAQVGHWLLSRGQVPETGLRDLPKGFSEREAKGWLTTSDGPMGHMDLLGPVACMSETQPYWARPCAPVGYHDPVWPARAAK